MLAAVLACGPRLSMWRGITFISMSKAKSMVSRGIERIPPDVAICEQVLGRLCISYLVGSPRFMRYSLLLLPYPHQGVKASCENMDQKIGVEIIEKALRLVVSSATSRQTRYPLPLAWLIQ